MDILTVKRNENRTPYAYAYVRGGCSKLPYSRKDHVTTRIFPNVGLVACYYLLCMPLFTLGAC